MFNAMQTKEDLLALLNYVRPMVYPESNYTFSFRQINYYCNYKNNLKANSNTTILNSSLLELFKKLGGKTYGGKYKTFQIKKKSGTVRTIHAPNQGLKAIQKCLNVVFQTVHTPHKSAMGFVPGKSIVDNARIHQGQNYVYNIDLKDFFPSIDQARIRGRFLVPPFCLDNSEGRKKIASILAILCCTSLETERLNEDTREWESKILNVLPQGAPTSPTITNIICEKLDIRLTGLAKRFGCKYTRYADDITFSSMHQVYQKDGDFIKELHRIIKDQNFHIQEKKTRLQKQGYRQEVTGLIVNESVNVNQRYVKKIRQWLYYWEQYGYEKASGIFQSKYQSDKGHTKKGKPNLENVLWGKLEYLKMVKGVKNSTYVAMHERYIALIGRPITEVIDIWEKDGIEKAMRHYYRIKEASFIIDFNMKFNRTLASEIEIFKSKGININDLRVNKNKLTLISDLGIETKSYYIGKKHLNENINSLKIDESDELRKWEILENGVGGQDWLYYQNYDLVNLESFNFEI